METIYSLLSVIHIICCFALIVLVVLQKGTEDGSILTSSNQFMSSSQTTDFITKVTRCLAVSFAVITLALAALGMYIGKKYDISQVEPQQTSQKQNNNSVPI